MTFFIRAASLNHYPEVASRHGLDPYRMLRQAGIALDCLYDPELLIPVARAYGLLEQSAHASGVRSFGLAMGEANQLSTLGLIGLILREEPTLRDMLQALMRYRTLHNESLVLRLEETAENCIVSLEYAAPLDRPVPQAVEQGLAMLVRTLRALVPQWQAKWLALTHAQLGASAAYQRVLAAPVRFNAEFNGVVFAATELDQSVRTADPAMAQQARAQLDQLLASRGAVSTRDRVRELVMLLLPLGRCSIDQVAVHLGVHRTTLHRQLLREGCVFSDIVEQVRKSTATQLIASSQRSLIQVADMLGFSSPPAFSRWYRASFGEAPNQHRKRLLRETAG